MARDQHGASILQQVRRFGAPFYLVACILAASQTAGADRTSEVFTPSHRLAADLLPLAQGILGEEGSAVLDPGRNTLVLIGSPGVVRETISVLQSQDTAVRTVVVRYREIDLQSLKSSGVSVSWRAEPGLGVGRIVETGNGAEAHSLMGRMYHTRVNREVVGELRIQSGETGRIGRGRSVPLPARDGFDRVVSGVARAERGFRAKATVLGSGLVRLELEAEDAAVNEKGVVNYSTANTTLTAAPGESFVVGSLTLGSASVRRDGRSFSTRSSREQQLFLITVDLATP